MRNRAPAVVSLPVLVLVSSPYAQDKRSEPTRVHARDSITREISGSETHAYRVALTARQALHLVVDQLGVDVVVTVSGPEGDSIVQMDSPNGANGPESVWIVAGKTGDYAVGVRPLDATAGGRYELRVETIRDATAEDQTRVRMQRAVVNGTRLLGQDGPENRIAAAKELKEAFVAALEIKDATTASTVGTTFVRLDPKAALDILGVPSAPGDVPLYYSRGHEQRGRELRDRITRAIRFFESRLSVTPKVMLAVLSQEDWTPVAIPPYGFPWSVSPSSSATPDRAALVVLPAMWDVAGPVARMTQPGVLAPSVTKALEATGLTMEEGVRLATDGIMYHELGHIYCDSIGLSPGQHWLNEFLANHLWVAYLTEGSLDSRAVAYTDAWRGWRLSVKPTHTSLEDFNRLYFGVGADFVWYQAQFEKRAEDAYKAQGLAFLNRAKNVLPPTKQPIPVDEALKRLEQVSPGFVEWAASLSARKQ